MWGGADPKPCPGDPTGQLEKRNRGLPICTRCGRVQGVSTSKCSGGGGSPLESVIGYEKIPVVAEFPVSLRLACRGFHHWITTVELKSRTNLSLDGLGVVYPLFPLPTPSSFGI